jgi:hypothetical protein
VTAGGRRARRGRWVVIGALAALVVAQLVPVERSNPAVQSDVDAPADVEAVLRRSCYDCHSNETRWPWYSRVAPVSWLVAHDVDEGRGHLNFSEWPVADFEARELELHDIEDELVRGEMPLKIYLVMHRDARLSEQERGALVQWARTAY